MEYTLITICALITLFGLAITVKCIQAQKRIQWLLPSTTPVHFSGKVSVVIPARNEEYDIAPALRSILNQEGVDLEIIVVNDHSSDRTGAIVDRIAQTNPRVTVLHNPPLQTGWLGKCNAMQQGALNATGEYLLFSDADIVHSPGCFTTVLNEMQQNRYDFISLFPRCINRSLWENINIPLYFFGVAKLLATPGLEDPASPNAVASGALMLIKSRVFKDINGFQDVKGAMFDDVGLAQLLKTRRYRVGYRLAPECVKVQLFKNNRDAFWGNTKNILTAVEDRVWLALPLMLLAILQYWAPVLALVLGIVAFSPWLIIVGFCTYAIQYICFFTVRRILRFHPLKLLFFPFVAIVGACCITRALYYHARGEIRWRGRTIKVKE